MHSWNILTSLICSTSINTLFLITNEMFLCIISFFPVVSPHRCWLFPVCKRSAGKSQSSQPPSEHKQSRWGWRRLRTDTPLPGSPERWWLTWSWLSGTEPPAPPSYSVHPPESLRSCSDLVRWRHSKPRCLLRSPALRWRPHSPTHWRMPHLTSWCTSELLL